MWHGYFNLPLFCCNLLLNFMICHISLTVLMIHLLLKCNTLWDSAGIESFTIFTITLKRTGIKIAADHFKWLIQPLLSNPFLFRVHLSHLLYTSPVMYQMDCSVRCISRSQVGHVVGHTDLAFKLDNKHLVGLILLDFSFWFSCMLVFVFKYF